MTKRTLPPLPAALVAAALTGCTVFGGSEAAVDLTAELSGLPGVDEVMVDDRTDAPFDNRVDVAVTMTDDAGEEQVADVLGTAYDRLRADFDDADGSLDLHRSEDVIAMSTGHSRAPAEDVRAAAALLARAASDGEVFGDVVTGDGPDGTWTHTTLRFRVPEGAPKEEIEALREQVRASYARTGEHTVEVRVKARRPWRG